MKTDTYVIGVRVAQRTNGADERDILSAAEVGRELLQALHSCGAKDSGFLVEAEIIVGDTRTEQPKSAGIAQIAQAMQDVDQIRTQGAKVIPMPNLPGRQIKETPLTFPARPLMPRGDAVFAAGRVPGVPHLDELVRRAG